MNTEETTTNEQTETEKSEILELKAEIEAITSAELARMEMVLAELLSTIRSIPDHVGNVTKSRLEAAARAAMALVDSPAAQQEMLATLMGIIEGAAPDKIAMIALRTSAIYQWAVGYADLCRQDALIKRFNTLREASTQPLEPRNLNENLKILDPVEVSFGDEIDEIRSQYEREEAIRNMLRKLESENKSFGDKIAIMAMNTEAGEWAKERINRIVDTADNISHADFMDEIFRLKRGIEDDPEAVYFCLAAEMLAAGHNFPMKEKS